MKPLPLLLLLLTALPTFARLGETKAECETRYGKPIVTLTDTERFIKADIQIQITYLSDKASHIEYERRTATPDAADKKPKDLTETELTVFLDANKGNSHWKKRASDSTWIKWERADGGASATYWVKTGSLTVQLTAFEEHMAKETAKAAAEKANKEAKKLDGF